MKIREDLLGANFYIKEIDLSIEINNENIDLLKSVNADVFDIIPKVSKGKIKDDNNKQSNE